MSDDVYQRLSRFLDKLPGGYPSTDSGVEIRILKKLFTEKDAVFVMKLKTEPQEVSVIARDLGMDEAAVADKLEDLAKRGLIFRVRGVDGAKYLAWQFVVGILEFQVKSMDRELAELMEEYMPYLGMAVINLKTRQLRVIPVGSSAGADPAVATYDRVRDLVKGQEHISVQECICRKEHRLVGNPCDRPAEICMSFGDFARFAIDNGTARQISTDECLKLLEVAEESNLVLCPSNTQELAWICCCCRCCCGLLRGLNLLPKPAGYVDASFQARIDPELCSLCGTCLERCQMDAIKEIDDSMEVDLGRCIGCGLCLASCTDEAISFVKKPEAVAPPKDMQEMLDRIRQERGLA